MTNSFQEDDYYGHDRLDMVAILPSSISCLLDVGCGEGGFLNHASQRANYVEGIEPNEPAAEAARARGFAVTTGLFPRTMPQGRRFDCIVFNDSLEHMTDPWEALRCARSLITEDGSLILSIPNIRNIMTLWAVAIHGDWRYTDAGVMDRTHLRFFTKRSIEEALLQAGFVPTEISGAWPIRSRLMRVLRLTTPLVSRTLYSECLFRQWRIVAKPC